MLKPITLVSRQSPLAVAQAVAIRAMLGKAARVPPEDWETAFPLQTHVTTGDKNLASSLSEVGGKGLFVKEIEAALINGSARIAIHSMKDMPAIMPEGLVLAAIPPREDPRDAFVTLQGEPLSAIAAGARIGTSSVRRGAQLRRLRDDIEVVPFRGNVGTRLSKLSDGVAEGTFLAEAGLRRLGHDEVKRVPMATDEMLPALGQGVLCIQTREDDTEARALCERINCPDTERVSCVERAFLKALDGSCRTPMAGLAELTGDTMRFRAEILSLDGSEAQTHDGTFDAGGHGELIALSDAEAHGTKIAERLLERASPALKTALSHA
ncbi:MAG: hydroxymethylbilane synthase [Pseudomonadota bacterium]